jgi:hypothetical protein
MVLGSIFDRHIHSRLDAKPMKTRSRLCRELQNLFGLGNDKGPQAPENHAHAMALHFLYYNFMRIHRTLKVTPAVAARVTDRLWEVADIISVLEAWESACLNASDKIPRLCICTPIRRI